MKEFYNEIQIENEYKIKEFEILNKIYSIYFEIIEKAKNNNNFIDKNDFVKLCYIMGTAPTNAGIKLLRDRKKVIRNVKTIKTNGKKITFYYLNIDNLKSNLKKRMYKILKKLSNEKNK